MVSLYDLYCSYCKNADINFVFKYFELQNTAVTEIALSVTTSIYRLSTHGAGAWYLYEKQNRLSPGMTSTSYHSLRTWTKGIKYFRRPRLGEPSLTIVSLKIHTQLLGCQLRAFLHPAESETRPKGLLDLKLLLLGHFRQQLSIK